MNYLCKLYKLPISMWTLGLFLDTIGLLVHTVCIYVYICHSPVGAILIIILCFSLYVVTSGCVSVSVTYSHVRALVYMLMRHCVCLFRCGFRFVNVLIQRIVVAVIYIGAKRTSGVNLSGGSVGGLYTTLTVVLPKPDS